MKNNKILFGILLTFAVTVTFLFTSPPNGYAQTSQDWSTPINLSLSGSAINPILVVDSTQTIHTIWIDKVNNEYKYSQSVDGSTWTPPQTVKFPFDPKAPLPVLLADGNGYINIFWISDSELFYGQTTSSFLPDPAKWKTITRLARDVLGFDAILDSRGALDIAYVRKSLLDANPAGVYYRQSIIGGGFWSEPIGLYTSKYFQSANESDTYISISTSSFQGNEQVYITWDNRALKRVYMAVSANTGLTWSEVRQIKGPDDTGGFATPFNLTVAASGNGVLLTWQLGNPGASACTVYSQWSEDGGENWGDAIAVLGGRSECPRAVKVIDRNGNYISVLMIGQIIPTLIAWDGERWSNIQTQILLPPISNPLTFDTVLLGCRFDFFYKQQLYVTGCDQGPGGDVWFLSRSLIPVEDWFSPLSFWGVENTLFVKSEEPKRISYFSSVADGKGNIHAMWSESSSDNNENSNNVIEYARWDGKQWTYPVTIFKSLNGMPAQLSVILHPLGRLLVLWVDNYSGNPVFSWSNLERANLPSEWANIIELPSPSELVSSPDSVVDGSGRIVTVYAVPINENRGIYVVQHTDNGGNWSVPIQAFDAVSAGWERIDQPRISLGFDGTLHLIFIRQKIRMGQPVGLYYSRSVDGGATWSVPQILSKSEIQWADIVSYGDRTVHVVWQEYDGLVFANVSQMSQDGGETWGKQNNVTGVSDKATHVALASDGRGFLHFVQLMEKSESLTINQEYLVLQNWKWDGNTWSPDLSNDVTIEGREIAYSLYANITSTGFLSILIPVEYTNPDKEINSEVLMFSRYLGESGIGETSQFAIIPTLTADDSESITTILQPTPTLGLSTLYDNNESVLSLERNIIGLVLIGIGVIVTFVLLIWKRPGNKEK